MSAITAAEINKLRQATGAGMMDCRKALTETNGDFEGAIDWLRKQGQKVAAKRSDREAKEGVIIAQTSADHKTGFVVCISCETDFVSKNAEFVAFAQTIADAAVANNVKTVEGPNDFATMEEAVYRRYKRILEENQSLPQLIIIDGGKGQLSSAVSSLKKLGIDKKVTVIGIAKRLEELYYPNDSLPMYLDKKSETLKIIQQLRDEAHRFGITFHRKKRDKGTLKTELEEIEGIGKSTAEKLLTHFKSVKRIKEASAEELSKLLNKKQVVTLVNYFNDTEAN